MGFRFRRSIKIVSGVRLNFSKSGTSVSVGGSGLHYTVGHGKRRTTVGIPGTGLSYTAVRNASPGNHVPPTALNPSSSRTLMHKVGVAGIIGFAAICCLWTIGHNSIDQTPAQRSDSLTAHVDHGETVSLPRGAAAPPAVEPASVSSATVAPTIVPAALPSATPQDATPSALAMDRPRNPSGDPKLAWYAAHPDSWPTPVKLRTIESFVAVKNGTRSRISAKPGDLVEVLEVKASGDIVVRYLNAVQTIRAERTDLLERAVPGATPAPAIVWSTPPTIPVSEPYSSDAGAASTRDYSSSYLSGGSAGSGTVHVRGYTRRDGTYVQPHTRAAPRGRR